MSQIVLGKVAFVDKGVYATASTYNTFDFVVTDDSCYLCVKDGNKNHPLVEMYRPWYAGNGSGQDRPCGGE